MKCPHCLLPVEILSQSRTSSFRIADVYVLLRIKKTLHIFKTPLPLPLSLASVDLCSVARCNNDYELLLYCYNVIR